LVAVLESGFIFLERISSNLAILFELDPVSTAMTPDAALLVLALVILYRNR